MDDQGEGFPHTTGEFEQYLQSPQALAIQQTKGLHPFVQPFAGAGIGA